VFGGFQATPLANCCQAWSLGLLPAATHQLFPASSSSKQQQQQAAAASSSSKQQQQAAAVKSHIHQNWALTTQAGMCQFIFIFLL
jgi:hypothetical protein